VVLPLAKWIAERAGKPLPEEFKPREAGSEPKPPPPSASASRAPRGNTAAAIDPTAAAR
jgi:hypothetical protein